MVVDTSALVAILLNEDDALNYATALASADELCMSAANWLETSMVAASRLGAAGLGELVRFLDDLGMEVITVDQALAEAALAGWVRFGKGRHAAGLNFGDCFSYALARQRNEPLLFKGNAFSLTDVIAAT